MEEVVQKVLQWVEGTLLAKIDIKNTYQNVPVHPADRLLLKMFWQGSIYVDATLPFLA